MCKHGNEWRSRHSCLGIGHSESFDAELWVIGPAHDVVIEKRDTLQMNGVQMVAVFSDSQATIRQAAHLQPGRGQ